MVEREAVRPVQAGGLLGALEHRADQLQHPEPPHDLAVRGPMGRPFIYTHKALVKS